MKLDAILEQIKATYDYPDVVQIWLRRPLSETDLRFLEQHSGDLKRARQLRTREPAHWDRRYRQLIRLGQPDEHAIEFLAKRNDIKMTYVELAHDLIFPDGKFVRELLRLTPIHFVQRWHRKRKATIFPNGNYRTAGLRGRGTIYQFYGDWHSKVTGEVHCYHAEAKIKGAAKLRRMGLHHPSDLLTFNLKQFWKRNLIFLDVDKAKLERWRKRAEDRPDNRDKRFANFMIRFGLEADGSFSMQSMIDRVGRGSWIREIRLEKRKRRKCSTVNKTEEERQESQHV